MKPMFSPYKALNDIHWETAKPSDQVLNQRRSKIIENFSKCIR